MMAEREVKARELKARIVDLPKLASASCPALKMSLKAGKRKQSIPCGTNFNHYDRNYKKGRSLWN
jgi:hypothetical protein